MVIYKSNLPMRIKKLLKIEESGENDYKENHHKKDARHCCDKRPSNLSFFFQQFLQFAAQTGF